MASCVQPVRLRSRLKACAALVAWVGAAAALVALAGRWSTLRADDASADSAQADSAQAVSGKPLVFRSVLTARSDGSSAQAGGGAVSDDAAAAAAARFDEASGQHPSPIQGGDLGPPRLLGNSLLNGGRDPFVRTAANQENVPTTDALSSPIVEAPSPPPENGPPLDVSPGFLAPRGGPVGPPPPGGLPNGPGGDWPHNDLRTQFGDPMSDASWCNRPYQVGAFLGFMRATELLSGRVDQNTGVLGGFRLGWDYDTYWGLEGRLAFASIQTETETAPIFDSANHATYWDTSLLYYPWGDSRWRPYLTLGIGLTEFNYFDETMVKRERGLIAVPMGGGLKYLMHDSWVLRFDLLDNIALGSSGLDTMNNFSFSSGFEYRFGGSHKDYWPWDPCAD